MATRVVFRDVEQLAIELLTASPLTELSGVVVATSVPRPRPVEFIRLYRSGGWSETTVTENVELIVEAWASTESRALALMNAARAELLAAAGPLFGGHEVGAVQNLPDPTTNQVRYTALIGIRSGADFR